MLLCGDVPSMTLQDGAGDAVAAAAAAAAAIALPAIGQRQTKH